MLTNFFNNILNDGNIRIRLFPVLIVVFVWSYGYMGTLTRSSLISQIAITGCLIVILVFLFFMHEKYLSRNASIDQMVMGNSDFKIVLSISVVIIILGSNYIFYSLVGDELSHSQSSQAHAIHGLLLLAKRLPSFITEQEMWILVWGISGFSLICSIALIYYVAKWNFKYKYLIISVVILLFFRAIHISAGGLDPPHPPFRLFPLWLSSSIFSPSSFSFRLPGIIALGLLGLILYRILKEKISSLPFLWLSISALLSIPLLWHTSYIVEPSIWAALFSTLFLLAFQSGKFEKFSFFTWFSLLAIFILMRQSLVFVAIPMLFLFITDRKTELFKNWKETIFTISPLLVVLPFLIRSMILGTPAHSNAGIESQLNLSEKLYHVASSGMLKNIILNNFEVWSIFIIFAFIPTKNNRLKYFITLALFTVSAIIVFYSIVPFLWGVPRYQSEYVVPLIVLGAVRLLEIIFGGSNKTIKYIAAAGLSCLLVYNLHTISIAHYQKTTKINGHKVITTHPIYDYRSALKTAKQDGYAGNTMTLGVTYGVMNEVLEGYTLIETLNNQRICKAVNTEFKGDDISPIVANMDIKLILISDASDKYRLYTQLIANGFVELKRFSNENTTDEIVALVRTNMKEAN